ncbi:hypothetical protein [Streptomyces sp. NPDC002671]
MAEFVADTIGLETGRYTLPCGCAIFVYFPGGTIHFVGLRTTKCAELSKLWNTYWSSCQNGQTWTSLSNYIACLRHIGAWERRIKSVEHTRSFHRKPVDDVPAEPTEKGNPRELA